MQKRRLIHRKFKGFTLVELIIVVFIIAILATLIPFAANQVMKQSRDKQRDTTVSIIANALERYFQRSGEYPACSVMADSAKVIEALGSDIDKGMLVAPRAAGDNSSLQCNAQLTKAMGDVYVYAGDGSAACNSTGACRLFTLWYWSEVQDKAIPLKSIHQVSDTTATAPAAPRINLTTTANDVRATANAVVCVVGTPEYAMRLRLNNGAWEAYSAWAPINPNRTVATDEGNTYDFQAKARCTFEVSVSADSVGPVAGYTRPVTITPAAPGVTITSGSGNVIGQANTVTCSQGSVEYAIRSRLNNGSWSSYTSWSEIVPAVSLAHAQGSKYDFQAKARCKVNSGVGQEAIGAVVTRIEPITAVPQAPTLTVGTSSSTSTPWSWTTSACPAGLTPQFRYVWGRDDTTDWRSWSGGTTVTSYSSITSDQGYVYKFKVQQLCQTAFANGNWSSDSNTEIYERFINAPSAPTGFAVKSYTLSYAGPYYVTSTLVYWNEPVCGPGTVPRFNFYYGNSWQSQYPNGQIGSAYGGAILWSAYTIDQNLMSYWQSSNPSSGMSAYYASAASVPASHVINPSNSHINRWYTYRVTYDNPLEFYSNDGRSSQLNSRDTFLRMYLRYACINTTTNRYAIGPHSFSPSWTWGGF